MCSANKGGGLTSSVQKWSDTAVGDGSTVCDMAQDTYGWRGYRNFVRLFGFAIPAAALAVGVVVAVPGLRIGEAAGTASVAVALIVAFGLGYAFDASPHRVDLYGHSREMAAAGLVLGFFAVAVTTLAGLVAYQLWPPGQELSFGACVLGPDVCGVLPRAVDPGPWLARYGIVGLAVTFAGAAQLFGVMYRPPQLDPRHVSDDVRLRRLWARAFDALILLLGVWGVIYAFGAVRSGTTGGALVSGGLVLGAFLYEFLALTHGGGRTVGKRVVGLQVVSTQKGGAVPPTRAVLRAVVTSVVYSFGTYVVLVFSLGRDIERTLVLQMLTMAIVSVSPSLHVSWQSFQDASFGTRVVRYRRSVTDSRTADDRSRLRLRPPIDGGDLLDRRKQVDVVSGVLRRAAGPAVVMVDAPWGGGKSTFLRMCAEELRAGGALVVEFNSWTQQYTKKPLVDLVGAISYQLRVQDGDTPGRDLKEQAAPLAEVFGRSRNNQRLFASWDSTHESISGFTTALSKVAKGQGRLVLLVDELDRCQPDYALGTLEALHHLFAVEGVVSLVGVSRDELCNSIRSLHGERFDTDTYLRRFTDLQIDLPPPTFANLTRFLEKQLETTGLTSRVPQTAAQILRLVTDLEDCSLRDLEQATHLAALALAPDPPAGHPTGVWEQSVMAMIVLRISNRETYRQFVRREINSFAALAAANAKLPPYPDIAEPPLVIPLNRTLFEAALLNVGPAEFEDTASFQRQYRHAHDVEQRNRSLQYRLGGTDEDAGNVLRTLSSLRQQSPTPPGWTPLRVELIADRLDLLAD